MRASYASGVLAALQAGAFVPDAIYGTSAGAALAAWYAAGQAADGVRTFDHAQDRRVLSYRRWLLGRGPLLDTEDLYGRVYVTEIPLDVETVRKAPYPVIMTAVDVATGETVYFDAREGDVLRFIRASSALPLAAGDVAINGRRYLDGGVNDPIPLARAIADGAREVTLVLNRRAIPRTPEPPFVTLAVGRRYPALLHAAMRHHVHWNAALALAQAPPDGVTVRIVAPQRDLGVGRMTREPERLAMAAAEGMKDGRTALASFADVSV